MMSDRSGSDSDEERMSCFDNANEREFLESVQLAAAPQQTFSKADDYFMRANTLDDEATELEKKLKQVKKSSEDFRMTAFDLRRLAAHDRAQIQAELDKVLDEHADIISLYGSNPGREKRLQDLLIAVEDGTVLPSAVNDIARELSSFRSAHHAKKKQDANKQLLVPSSEATVKRERESSSGDDSSSKKAKKKKARLDEIDEAITKEGDEMSIAGSYSADEADEEKDSDEESVILGSPMKPIPIEYMAAGRRKHKMQEIETDPEPEPRSSSPYSERIVPLRKSKKNKHNRQQPQVYRETTGPQILDNDLPVVRSTDLADIPIIYNTEDLQAEKKKNRKSRGKKKRESGNFEKEANLADLEMKRRVSFKAMTDAATTDSTKDKDTKRRHSLKAQKQKHYDL